MHTPVDTIWSWPKSQWGCWGNFWSDPTGKDLDSMNELFKHLANQPRPLPNICALKPEDVRSSARLFDIYQSTYWIAINGTRWDDFWRFQRPLNLLFGITVEQKFQQVCSTVFHKLKVVLFWNQISKVPRGPVPVSLMNTSCATNWPECWLWGIRKCFRLALCRVEIARTESGLYFRRTKHPSLRKSCFTGCHGIWRTTARLQPQSNIGLLTSDTSEKTEFTEDYPGFVL